MNSYPKWVYNGNDGIIVDDEAQHEVAKENGFTAESPAPKKVAKKKAAKQAK